MSKADVYQSIALPQSQQPEIAQATATAVQRIYEAQLRKIAIRLGLGDPGKVALTNKPILKKIQQHGQKVGTAVVNVTNRMAQNQLKNLSDDLSDPQLLDKLGPWMKAAELHNQRVIIPFNARYAQQQAERDFVQNNPGITQSWRVDPAETPSNDVCREAIDLGEVGDEIMSDPIYEFPAHPNCPHLWQPVDSDVNESIDEAWLGGPVKTKTALKATTVRSFEEMLEESLTTSMRAYHPDQPRDQDGKWSAGGAGGSGGGAAHVKGPSDNPRQKGRGLETTKGGGKAVVGGAVEEGHNAAAQLVHANMGTGYAAKGKIEGTALPHVEGLIDAGKGAHYVAWPNHTTGTNGASGYPRYQTGEDMAGEVQAMKGEIKDIRKTIKGARATQFGAVDPKTGLSPGHLQLQGIGDRITNAATTLNHYAPESMPPNHPFVQSMRQHLRQAAHGDFTDNAQVRLDSYQSSLIPLEQARRLQEHAIRRHVTSGKPLIGKTGVVSIKGDTRYMGVNEGATGGSAT